MGLFSITYSIILFSVIAIYTLKGKDSIFENEIIENVKEFETKSHLQNDFKA